MTDSDDELLKRLDRLARCEIHDNFGHSDGGIWGEAANRIRELKAELAFYKGFHDGVCKDGSRVIVPVEPTEAMIDAGWVYESNSPDIYEFDVKELYRVMIKAAQEN